MEILTFISNFLYRIRYKLVVGTTLAVLLTIYLSSFLPKVYNVTSTIFTGITSKTSINDMSGRVDWNTSNNAHDNIINLTKSKSTLESISTKLIAQHLMCGSATEDTKYISAKNYRSLKKLVPQEVLDLVDKNSFDKTVANLKAFKKDDRRNFIYAIFNWDNEYYGHLALSAIKVMRKGASDMIEISYQCDDAGIAASTLTFLNEELSVRYENLLLSASNDVVRYFEEQLAEAKQRLDKSEEELVAFNVEYNIINYEEQTKHLAALNNNFQAHYETVLLEYNSSQALIKTLETQMETRTSLAKENSMFVSILSQISHINGRIAEIEIFGGNDKSNALLTKYKTELDTAQKKLAQITDNIDVYKYSKEGVRINDMVSEWLAALLSFEKSKAELSIMENRKKEITDQYTFFSPVGPNLGRQTRNIRVEEESYLTILYNLGQAKMRQKNILLDTGTLQVVTPPDIPLLTQSRRRELLTFAALIGALIFITGFYLVIEMLDRTIRDAMRVERFSGGKTKVIGAFPSDKRIKYRGFIDQARKMASAHVANIINGYIKPEQPLIINLMSSEPREGKTFIAENLEDYWSQMGFKVAHLSHEIELSPDSKLFYQTQSIFDFPNIGEKIAGADIIISEYSSLTNSNIPKDLLKQADLNLVILDAERTWLPSDRQIFDNLKDIVGDHPLFIYLNNAEREVVEQYTGQLPPHTFLRKFIHKLVNFGFTAKR